MDFSVSLPSDEVKEALKEVCAVFDLLLLLLGLMLRCKVLDGSQVFPVVFSALECD